jgi:LacI family transcriptional regulator|tara:strand:- start:174 stop:1178 length:1005 start_codon:yes stop_codon:yes gene_type:complete
MKNKPNLHSVAKDAGVSISTVSQVMRNVGRISEATRKKIKLSAKKLNYITDQRASSLRTGKINQVGLVLYNLSNPFNSEVINGVSDYLDTHGYLVSILDSKGSQDRQQRNLTSFIGNGKAGIIWVPTRNTPQSTINFLIDQKIPLVTFLRPVEFDSFDHVGINNFKATFEATEHLINLGHKNIIYLGGSNASPVHMSRVEGFEEAYKTKWQSKPVIWDSGHDKKSSLDATLLLFSKFPETTALVCDGDTVALGAMIALNTLNLTPGKEVSIIGFDDIIEASISMPPLTTLSLAPYQLGQKVAQVLIERIQQPDLPRTIVTIDAKLVIRETTNKI